MGAADDVLYEASSTYTDREEWKAYVLAVAQHLECAEFEEEDEGDDDDA